MPTSVTSSKLAEAVQSCLVLLVRSLEVCRFLIDPGTGCGLSPLCQFCRLTHFPTFILPVRWSNHFLEAKFKSCFGPVQSNVAVFESSQTLPPFLFQCRHGPSCLLHLWLSSWCWRAASASAKNGYSRRKTRRRAKTRAKTPSI